MARKLFNLADTATSKAPLEEEQGNRIATKANLFLQDLSNTNHPTGELREILISLIDSKNNPRQTFPQDELMGLANNIKAHGLLQPIIVKKSGKRFELIAGERRMRAVAINGNATITAIVQDVDYFETDIIPELKLTENLQRVGLSDLETSLSLTEIKARMNYSNSDLVNRFGYSESWVKQKLAHAKLAEEIISKNIVPSVSLLDKLPTTHILLLKPLLDSNPDKTAKWLIPKLKTGSIPSRKEIQEFGGESASTTDKHNPFKEKSNEAINPKSRIVKLKQKIKKDKDLIATIENRISKNESILAELQNRNKKK